MKILISDKLAEEAIEYLRDQGFEVDFNEVSPEELLNVIPDYEAIIVRSRTKVTSAVIDAGTALKVIGRAGIGVDNIDCAYAKSKGIPVVYAPTGSTLSVAELAIGHMMALARHIPQATVSMKANKWEKKKFMGIELNGKTLGFIGSGRIGCEVARLAKVFNMTTISYDPYLDKGIAERYGLELTDLETVLKTSDFITIHAVITDETRGMVGAEQLAMMKTTAYLVNCARGGIVDEDALYDALKEGKIAGAALDVFASEPPKDTNLVELDNILLSPHIGASTKEGQLRAGTIVAEQVKMVLNGEQPEFFIK